MEGHDLIIKSHEDLFKEIKMDIDRIDAAMMKGAERLALNDASIKSMHKRMDSREEELKVIQKLAYSMESLTQEVAKIAGKVDIHSDELINLKHRPAKTIADYFDKIVTYVLLAGAGFLFAKLIGG